MLTRKLYFCALLLYIPFLITITFIYPSRERNTKTYQYYFIPLQSTIAQIKDPAQYNTPGYWRVFAESLTGNFLLFIPPGFFLRFFVRRKNFILLMYALALSISIEITQLFFHSGVCDIDDVILNGGGAFAGIALCSLMHGK